MTIFYYILIDTYILAIKDQDPHVLDRSLSKKLETILFLKGIKAYENPSIMSSYLMYSIPKDLEDLIINLVYKKFPKELLDLPVD